MELSDFNCTMQIPNTTQGLFQCLQPYMALSYNIHGIFIGYCHMSGILAGTGDTQVWKVIIPPVDV